MLYTKKTKKAIKIMFEKHKNQVDKSNIPYVFHPWHIAEKFSEEKNVIVSLLHDVLEDTDTTIDELRKEGFDEEIIEALKVLNHEKGEDYFSYIKKIAKNPLARDVKIADLKHNMDLTRLDNIIEKDKKRLAKYQKCLEYLETYISDN